jgi:ankyrin repeat protein
MAAYQSAALTACPAALLPCCATVLLCTAAIVQLVDAGFDVNEVEAAGNTPLHSAAFEGWLEGAQLLLQLGAKVNASNNAGDTPWVSAGFANPTQLDSMGAVCGDKQDH